MLASLLFGGCSCEPDASYLSDVRAGQRQSLAVQFVEHDLAPTDLGCPGSFAIVGTGIACGVSGQLCCYTDPSPATDCTCQPSGAFGTLQCVCRPAASCLFDGGTSD